MLAGCGDQKEGGERSIAPGVTLMTPPLKVTLYAGRNYKSLAGKSRTPLNLVQKALPKI